MDSAEQNAFSIPATSVGLRCLCNLPPASTLISPRTAPRCLLGHSHTSLSCCSVHVEFGRCLLSRPRQDVFRALPAPWAVSQLLSSAAGDRQCESTHAGFGTSTVFLFSGFVPCFEAVLCLGCSFSGWGGFSTSAVLTFWVG